MSQAGQNQPQPKQPKSDQRQQSALMTGPDGVVYHVTPAGTVPTAFTTTPARHGAPRHENPPRRQPGAVSWRFSYSATGPMGPCFSYPSSPYVSYPAAGGCFSYSPDQPSGSTGRDTAQKAPDSLPAMPHACFSYFSALPPGSTDRDTAQETPDSLPAMPVFACFSYSPGLPPGNVGPCFSYPDPEPPSPGGIRRMPEIGPCFSYSPDLPAMPATSTCFGNSPDLPPGNAGPCFSCYPATPCFSYLADLSRDQPAVPGGEGFPAQSKICFSY